MLSEVVCDHISVKGPQIRRMHHRAYWRFFDAGTPEKPFAGVRLIRTATSKDFIHWENQADLDFGDSPREHLYTNQIKPYERAPHLFIGFPARYRERGHLDQGDTPHGAPREATQAELVAQWPASLRALPDLGSRLERASAHERYGSAITEGLLMASRDGVNFKRWNEAFLPPGVEREGTWNYGHQYIGWHAVETKSALAGAPNELSLYAVENYWTATGSALRRYTLRLDGFVSVKAGADGGELLTKPIKFAGKTLALNFSTSAAGSVRVEIQDADGTPLPGFSLEECELLFGDTIERKLRWQQGPDVSSLSNRVVRLRCVLQDADVYSYQFNH